MNTISSRHLRAACLEVLNLWEAVPAVVGISPVFAGPEDRSIIGFAIVYADGHTQEVVSVPPAESFLRRAWDTFFRAIPYGAQVISHEGQPPRDELFSTTKADFEALKAKRRFWLRLGLALVVFALAGLSLLFTGCTSVSLNRAARMRMALPYESSCVGTGSMRPTLVGGERYTIAPIDFNNVTRGMIVVYCPPWCDAPVIHRVIETGQGWLVTKGDACRKADSPRVTPEMFVGVAIFAGCHREPVKTKI